MNNQNTITEYKPFVLPAPMDETFDSSDVVEDMEGLELSFPRVKIPGGGVPQFKMPGEDPDHPVYTGEIEGVILFNHSANACWPEGSEYDDNTPPQCQSPDGKQGYGDPGILCASCGYTRDHHPDTVCWSDWKNFGYKWETKLGFTWETPCGLLIQGESDVGRSLAISECSYQRVWYCPENNNPLLRCPYQQKGCAHVPQGFPLVMCPCHQTDRPYDYEMSVEKLEAEHNQEAHKQYMELTGGSYCACVVSSNGYQGGWYQVKYDVNTCIQCQCQNPVCAIRKKPRDLKKVNIFYDVRRTWITRRGFLEEKKVTLTKGLKVFDHAVAQTDAEIWLKIKKHGASPLNNYAVIEHPKKTMEDRRQEYFSHMHRHYDDIYDYFEFHYEVENIRIARSGQRDLLQDLRDAAEGIEVVHNIDQLKARTAEKRAARTHRRELKTRKAQAVALPPQAEEQLSIFGGDYE